jgi:hypothetical protein
MDDVAWSAQQIPTAVNLGFLDWNCYFSIQVAPQLFSRGWVDPVPVPDPLILRKSCSVENRTRNLWICSQELWPLDHRTQNKLLSVGIMHSRLEYFSWWIMLLQAEPKWRKVLFYPPSSEEEKSVIKQLTSRACHCCIHMWAYSEPIYGRYD